MVACGGNEAAEPTTTTAPDPTTTVTAAPTTTTTTATTVPTPTTTYAQADEPPELVQTGEDFAAIMDSVLAFSEWLSVHPDPARVLDYSKAGSPHFEQTTAVVQALVDQRLHTDGLRPAYITETSVLERLSDDLVLVYVAIVNPAFDFLAADGSVVRSEPDSPPRGFSFQLERQVDSRWLVVERTDLGEIPS
jgi:hypothetical protein